MRPGRDGMAGDRFARRVFRGAAWYGIALLVPLYFLEDAVGRVLPPAGNRPDQYYGFLGVALAWQFAFLCIAADPRRFRPLMLPATAEKLLSGAACVVLIAMGRVPVHTLAPAVVDLAWGLLFLAAHQATRPRQAAPALECGS